MPIVNSHYVPLNEPYPIIYYGGSVAMQIGTLIVVYGPGEEQGMYGHIRTSKMTTRSHPVVAYGNKYVSEPREEWRLNMWSEGVVWDYVQLKDIFTFCFHNQKEVNYEAIDVLTTTIRLKEAVNGSYKYRISSVLKDLERMGIKTPDILSQLLPKGPAQVSINRNLAKDIICVRGFGALFCCVRLGDKIDEAVTEIRRQVADYLMLLKPREIKLTYETDFPECEQLVNLLNTESK